MTEEKCDKISDKICSIVISSESENMLQKLQLVYKLKTAIYNDDDDTLFPQTHKIFINDCREKKERSEIKRSMKKMLRLGYMVDRESYIHELGKYAKDNDLHIELTTIPDDIITNTRVMNKLLGR